MVILTKEYVDSLLMKKIHQLGFHDPDVDIIKGVCSNYKVVDLFSISPRNIVRYKTRKGWCVKLESKDAQNRLTNFASIRNGGGCDAVWARQNDKDEYIIGATSMDAFHCFLDDHFDVVAYYYASIVPGSLI